MKNSTQQKHLEITPNYSVHLIEELRSQTQIAKGYALAIGTSELKRIPFTMLTAFL